MLNKTTFGYYLFILVSILPGPCEPAVVVEVKHFQNITFVAIVMPSRCCTCG